MTNDMSRRRGRPAKGPQPMTTAQKSREYRQRLYAARRAHSQILAAAEAALTALDPAAPDQVREALEAIRNTALRHKP